MSASNLRSKALTATEAKSIEVEYEGDKFELRQPNVGVRQDILKRAQKGGELDPIELYIWFAIKCIHDPEAGGVIFEDTDYEAFKSMESGGFLDVVMAHAPELLNLNISQEKKN